MSVSECQDCTAKMARPVILLSFIGSRCDGCWATAHAEVPRVSVGVGNASIDSVSIACPRCQEGIPVIGKDNHAGWLFHLGYASVTLHIVENALVEAVVDPSVRSAK